MEQNFTENQYLHALNLLPQFGPTRLMKLANAFKTFGEAFHAPAKALLAAGIETDTISLFEAHRATLDLALSVQELANEQIHIVSFRDTAYPKLLLEISHFPPILYYKGHMENSDELCLGVVGTRKISSYGRTILPTLVEPLAQAGVTIVSGLAYGVDALAHTTTTKAAGRTIAVLGCGLDTKTIYPQDHVLLVDEILKAGGAIISEYPPRTPAFRQHFVARNRIISGLSVGTLVVECDIKSGALITGKYALEQNRNVYAVPGPIYAAESRGPNNLLKMGAKAVTEASDILSDLNITPANQTFLQTQSYSFTNQERALLKHLSFDAISSDELITAAGLDASTVTATLTYLEMKGAIRNLGAQQYILARKV